MKKALLVFAAAAAFGLSYPASVRAAECAPDKDSSNCSSEKVAACEKKSEKNAGMEKGGASADSKNGLKVGDHVENFTLSDASGKSYSLADFKDKVTVVVFYNQECPYVVEARGRISDFAKKYESQGVQVLAIDAGTNNTKESIGSHSKENTFPILINGDSGLARTFGAGHTPETFVIDKKQNIAYRGAFDNGQLAAKDGRKAFTEDAVQAVLRGETPAVTETKAIGCTIKFAKKAEAADHIEKKAQKPDVKADVDGAEKELKAGTDKPAAK